MAQLLSAAAQCWSTIGSLDLQPQTIPSKPPPLIRERGSGGLFEEVFEDSYSVGDESRDVLPTHHPDHLVEEGVAGDVGTVAGDQDLLQTSSDRDCELVALRRVVAEKDQHPLYSSV